MFSLLYDTLATIILIRLISAMELRYYYIYAYIYKRSLISMRISICIYTLIYTCMRAHEKNYETTIVKNNFIYQSNIMQ